MSLTDMMNELQNVESYLESKGSYAHVTIASFSNSKKN